MKTKLHLKLIHFGVYFDVFTFGKRFHFRQKYKQKASEN